MKYKLRAEVKRTVLDTIAVKVDADSLDEAMGLAFVALESYPAPHDRPQVGFVYVENRDTLETEIVSIREDRPDDKSA